MGAACTRASASRRSSKPTSTIRPPLTVRTCHRSAAPPVCASFGGPTHRQAHEEPVTVHDDVVHAGPDARLSPASVPGEDLIPVPARWLFGVGCAPSHVGSRRSLKEEMSPPSRAMKAMAAISIALAARTWHALLPRRVLEAATSTVLNTVTSAVIRQTFARLAPKGTSLSSPVADLIRGIAFHQARRGYRYGANVASYGTRSFRPSA